MTKPTHFVDPTLDPFSMVYVSLCKQVAAQDTVRKMVKERNIICFDEKDPLRDPVQKGNLPELMIATSGNPSGSFKANTSSAKVTRIYQFMITSGTLNLVRLQQPIEFAVFAALTQWCSCLPELKWCGTQFVKAVRYTDTITGMTDPRLNRGIKGWNSITAISVEMYFPLHLLKEFSNVRT